MPDCDFKSLRVDLALRMLTVATRVLLPGRDPDKNDPFLKIPPASPASVRVDPAMQDMLCTTAIFAV
jgi:hypothetical protein